MASEPSASRNSRFIIHLASCPNRSLPTDSTDDPIKEAPADNAPQIDAASKTPTEEVEADASIWPS